MDTKPTPDKALHFCGRWLTPLEMNLLRTMTAVRSRFPNRSSLIHLRLPSSPPEPNLLFKDFSSSPFHHIKDEVQTENCCRRELTIDKKNISS